LTVFKKPVADATVDASEMLDKIAGLQEFVKVLG
jgi:hypothetical protein